MPRPFSQKIRSSDWWLEQAAHGWLGYLAAMIGSAFFDLLFKWNLSTDLELGIAMSSAAVMGMAREIGQNVGDKDNDVWDAVFDALIVFLGGVLYCVPVWIHA